MIPKYLLAWIPMVFIAIINGSLRQFTYGTLMSELLAHQISTLTAVFFFGVYIYFVTNKWKISSTKQAFQIGFLWLVFTVLFEFGFGHYLAGNSWEKLLHDYNLFAGRIWILILIWISIAPYLFYRYHKK